MRGHLTKWLFGMGLVFFCTGGWALHHAARAHPGSAARSLHGPTVKACRAIHGTPALSSHPCAADGGPKP
jgi:hypothetical protein